MSYTDQSKNIRGVIARTETNKKGQFEFELNPHALRRQFQSKTHEAFLLIKKDNRVVFFYSRRNRFDIRQRL